MRMKQTFSRRYRFNQNLTTPLGLNLFNIIVSYVKKKRKNVA